MSAFVIELHAPTANDFENLSDLMASVYDDWNQQISELAKDLDISQECANDVWYLRTRSRWSQGLEDELIRLYKIGEPPNINEFGCTPYTAHEVAHGADLTDY